MGHGEIEDSVVPGMGGQGLGVQSSDPNVTREDVEQTDLWAAQPRRRQVICHQAPSQRPLLPRRPSSVILAKAFSELTGDKECGWPTRGLVSAMVVHLRRGGPECRVF